MSLDTGIWRLLSGYGSVGINIICQSLQRVDHFLMLACRIFQESNIVRFLDRSPH